MTATEISRVQQGLPATITDSTTLSKIAALVSLPLTTDGAVGDGMKADRRRRQRREAKAGGVK